MNEYMAPRHPDLDAFLDGFTAESDGEAVREHLAGCRRCADELAAMLSLREMARALPSEVKPREELWAGIAARIATPSVAPLSEPVRARTVHRWFPSSVAAAAGIAALLVAGTAGYLLRGTFSSGAEIAGAAPAESEDPPAGLVAFSSSEADYRATVEMLEAELEARREGLSPETVAAVEENLAIIDRAIEEAREALARDPSSAELPLLLAGVYRQKVEVLSDVLLLSARS